MSAGFIGHTPMNYVNPDTGEVITGYWAPNPERQFYKHELNAFVHTLSKSTDKAMNVLGYLLSRMDYSNNMVRASYTSIAKDMSLARSTVILALTALQENDDVRLVRYGIWMINPRLHSRGYESKTIRQMAEYDSLETLADRRAKKEKETDADD